MSKTTQENPAVENSATDSVSNTSTDSNVQAKVATLQPVPTRVRQKLHVPARLAVLKQLLQRKQKHHLIPIPLFNRIKL